MSHPRAQINLEKQTNADGPGIARSVTSRLELLHRDDATSGYDSFDSRRLILPTTVGGRNGEVIGLETSLLAVEGTRDGKTTFLDRNARPLPASNDDYPLTYDLTFDCANLDEDATYVIDVAEAENLDSDWGLLLKDTHRRRDPAVHRWHLW